MNPGAWDGEIPEGARPSKGSVLGRYIWLCEQCTDAPPIYHLAGGLVIMASLAGREVWVEYGPGRLFLNLWCVLVGRSSLDRKSTAIRLAKRELNRVDGASILPTEFSRERLEERIAAECHGTMFWFEMANSLRSMEREGSYLAGVKEMLTEWYDGDAYTRETREKTIKAEATPLTIMAGTTLDWWEATMRRSDLSGGFLPRWAVFYAENKTRSEPFPVRPAPQALDEIHQSLVEASHITGEIEFPKDIREAYKTWYVAAEKRVLGAETGVHATWSRLSSATLKLAGLYAMSYYKTKVDMESLRRAISLSQWLMESARHLLGRIATDRDERDTRTVLDILARILPDAITRGDLLRASRLSARRLDMVLSTLVQRDEVGVQKIPPTRTSGGGRATTAYRFKAAGEIP